MANRTDQVSTVIAQADVDGLVAALAGKASTSHTHAQSDVTGLVAALANLAPLTGANFSGNVTAPAFVGPTATSAIRETAFGEMTVDDGSGGFCVLIVNGPVNATDFNASAGITLGGVALGTLFAAASHNHAASAITSGTIATARLGSGTANSGTYLRGDQTWAAVSAGDVVGPASSTDNAFARFDSTTGKLLQNSGVTADDSGNVATTGSVIAGNAEILSLFGSFAGLRHKDSPHYAFIQQSPGDTYLNGTEIAFRIQNANKGKITTSGNWYFGTGTPGDASTVEVGGSIDATAYKVGGAAGADGTFTTTDGKTVTVSKGLITSIV